MIDKFSTKINAPVVVLAGGLGTRLRESIGTKPKILAPVGNTLFINVLLNWLIRQNVKHVVFSLGYESAQIIQVLQKPHIPSNLQIDYAIEPEPLGTLGGLSYTINTHNLRECIVINGDTFIDTNLSAFYETQKLRNTNCGLIATEVPDVSRFGEVLFDHETGVVTKFVEKQPDKNCAGWINAGIYYFSDKLTEQISACRKGNLEKDFLYHRLSHLHIYQEYSKCFIDIGTPESFIDAQEVLKEFL